MDNALKIGKWLLGGMAYLLMTIMAFFLGKTVGWIFPNVSDLIYWIITFAVFGLTMFIATYNLVKAHRNRVKS